MSKFVNDQNAIQGQGVMTDGESGHVSIQSEGPSGNISIEGVGDYPYLFIDDNVGVVEWKTRDSVSGHFNIESVCGEIYFSDGFVKNYPLTNPSNRELVSGFSSNSLFGNLNEVSNKVSCLQKRNKNEIRVSKNPCYEGDFSDLEDAIASIEEDSVIVVYPGEYILDNSSGPIALPGSSTIKSKGHSTVIFKPLDPDQDLFICSQDNCRLQGVTIKGVSGATAITSTKGAFPSIFDVITISGCKVGVHVQSFDENNSAVFRNLRIISGSTTERLIDIESVSGHDSVVRIYSGILTDDDGTSFQEAIKIHGPGSRLDPNTVLIRSTVGVGDGINLRNGAHLEVHSGTEVHGFDRNLVFENIGVPPTTATTSIALHEGVTYDLLVDHPDAEGDMFGIFTRARTEINALGFTVGFQDPETGDLNCNRILATRGFATDLTNYDTVSGVQQIEDIDAHTVVATGSTSGFALELPDATTLREGHQYWIINASTVQISVRLFDGSDEISLTSGSSTRYVLRENATQAGVWSRSVGSSSPFSGTAPILSSYGGGANAGRYLEVWTGTASNEGPFLVPVDSVLVAMSLGGQGGSLYTTTVGIFDVNDLVTPIATISLNNENNVTNTSFNIPINANVQIAIRVTDGSINKPRFAMYLSGA